MMGDPLIELAISVLGVLALLAIAYTLGAMRSAKADEANVKERLAFDEPDFAPGLVVIGEDQHAAVARTRDGSEIALIFVVGDGFVTRRRKRTELPMRQEGAKIIFSLGEPAARRVTLALRNEAEATALLSQLTHAAL